MNLPFPHANIVVGFLVLLVGFVFHWLGQLISLCNWEMAARIGLAEKDIPRFVTLSRRRRVSSLPLKRRFFAATAAQNDKKATSWHMFKN